MQPIDFQTSLVSRNADGSISIALAEKHDGERQLVLRGSRDAATGLALALAVALLQIRAGAPP